MRGGFAVHRRHLFTYNAKLRIRGTWDSGNSVLSLNMFCTCWLTSSKHIFVEVVTMMKGNMLTDEIWGGGSAHMVSKLEGSYPRCPHGSCVLVSETPKEGYWVLKSCQDGSMSSDMLNPRPHLGECHPQTIFLGCTLHFLR